MPKQEESKTVNYSKDQMFDLVADIDRYDEFLAWCNNSKIIDTSIKGDKKIVFRINKDNVSLAAQTIPNISKILPDYQYYRSDKVLSAREEVLERLGKTSEQGEAQQETTTTTQTTTAPKTNTQQSAPTGPPSGVVTGGAGGGSY